MRLNRKWLWILALAVLALVTNAPAAAYQGGGYAGGPGGGGGRRGPISPDDELKRMTKDFDLTSDQRAKIKPILVDAQKKMDDARNDSSGDRQAMRQKMMQIRRDSNDQVREQLDDKQKEKFDKQQQERQERMQNRRGGPGGPGGPGGGEGPGDNPPPQN